MNGPKIECAKGYGIPLFNLTNPGLQSILLGADTLKEIVDMFDHPPLWRFVGDKVYTGKC